MTEKHRETEATEKKKKQFQEHPCLPRRRKDAITK
jgi:hypothetical protein